MGLLDTPLLTGGNVQRGTRCYGCDTKLATIIVNIIDVGLDILLMILLTLTKNDFLKEEQTEETIHHINQYYILTMVFAGLSIGINILAITGACLYNRRLIIFNVVWDIIGVILTFIFGVGLRKMETVPVESFLTFGWPIVSIQEAFLVGYDVMKQKLTLLCFMLL